MYKLATILTFMCEVRQTNPIVEVLGQDVIDPGLLLRGEELGQVGSVVPTKLKTYRYQLGLTETRAFTSWAANQFMGSLETR